MLQPFQQKIAILHIWHIIAIVLIIREFLLFSFLFPFFLFFWIKSNDIFQLLSLIFYDWLMTLIFVSLNIQMTNQLLFFYNVTMLFIYIYIFNNIVYAILNFIPAFLQ